MSWLSKELGRSKLGKVVNTAGKVPLSMARKFIGRIPIVGDIADAADAVGDYIPEIGKKGIPGLPKIGKIPDFLGGGGDGWMKALAAAQGLNAANLGRQSTEYAKNAMKTQDDLWKQRAGLRSGGIEGLNRTPVALPQLGAMGARANPFASVGNAPPMSLPSVPVPPPGGDGTGGLPAVGTLGGIGRGSSPDGMTFEQAVAEQRRKAGQSGMLGSIKGSSPDGMTFEQAAAKQRAI